MFVVRLVFIGNKGDNFCRIGGIVEGNVVNVYGLMYFGFVI